MTDVNSPEGREVFRVGDLVLDAGARLLRRGTEVVALPPKTFELLLELVRRAPGVVKRTELMDSVWPHEIVNDEALTQRVMLLRRSLGDDPHQPRYIASVPRWGYRLVAPVERVGAAAAAPPAIQGAGPEPPAVAAPRPLARDHAAARSLILLLAPLVVVALVVAAYLIGGRGTPTDSLAILPFVVGGGDAGTDVMADGIRETLTNALSHLPRLRVIAASTMSRFRSTTPDPQKVGRELGVRTVVTGRLVQQGETLEVNVELVSVADGTQLWGGGFNRPLSDIFVVQEDLAAQIVQHLRPKLAATDRDLVRTRYTDNVAAYQLYLKGRYHWNKRSVQGFYDAIGCFRQAIASDPSYALAYAGLADCYALLGDTEYGELPPREAMPRARSAAAHALELDPALAEAHASLALVQWMFDWNRDAAERSLRRAIELAPGYASSHQWYGEMLAEAGRLREAEGEIRRALDLDPLSLPTNADLGLLAYYGRDFDRAIASYRATLAMEQSFVPARLGLALAYTQKGLFSQALAELGEASKVAPDDPGATVTMGYVLGRAGRSAEARAVADEMQRLSTQRFVPAYFVAGVFVGAGDTDAAFTWLARACEERCSLLGSLRVDPAFDPLRNDPRFAELLRCAGLAR